MVVLQMTHCKVDNSRSCKSIPMFTLWIHHANWNFTNCYMSIHVHMTVGFWCVNNFPTNVNVFIFHYFPVANNKFENSLNFNFTCYSKNSNIIAWPFWSYCKISCMKKKNNWIEHRCPTLYWHKIQLSRYT